MRFVLSRAEETGATLALAFAFGFEAAFDLDSAAGSSDANLRYLPVHAQGLGLSQSLRRRSAFFGKNNCYRPLVGG